MPEKEAAWLVIAAAVIGFLCWDVDGASVTGVIAFVCVGRGLRWKQLAEP